MKTFTELKRNCKQNMDEFPEIRISVMGDCATQFLSKAIRGYGYTQKLNINVLDTDYNQIDAQTMDKNSETYNFNPDYILIQNCTERLYEKYCSFPLGERDKFAEIVLSELNTVWDRISKHCNSKILQFNFPEVDDAVFGNYANKVAVSFLFQQRKLNILLMELAQKNKNIYIIDIASLQNRLGRAVLFDEKYYYSAKMPISIDAIPHVAKIVTDIILSLRGKIKKCIVLDLDNTLWGGVIGDDGMSGIQIGELGAGHAFSDFQMWLRELRNRGIVLAICSKNNEYIAKEPFLKHPDMILRMDDISMFVANWDDKASNIKFIQQTLNLGMDSFVFIDDNPFERNMVRSLIPEITVPELPEDPASYLDFIQSLNLFETPSFSEEDYKRTKQYQAEISRVTLQKQYESIDDYLISLEMKAEAKSFDEFNFPRIAQLTQRSNQFNLRTIRYTESDITKIASDDKYITLYFTLRDKFGDHGLISVVILEKQGSGLFINTWLMSCRVLKRGMEEFIVNRIVKAAKDKGFKSLTGEYLPTHKNVMVRDIYEKMGFNLIEKNDLHNLYKVDVDNFKNNKTYIEEV